MPKHYTIVDYYNHQYLPGGTREMLLLAARIKRTADKLKQTGSGQDGLSLLYGAAAWLRADAKRQIEESKVKK